MFRDLKEYQQIQKIYEERVCISEEDRYITKELEETFTEDELNFIVENTEEVFAEISNQLVEEGSEITEETIDEMAKVISKVAVPLAQRMAKAASKLPAKKVAGGITKKVAGGGIAKKTASGGGGLMKKSGGLIKKGVGFVKKNVGKIATAVGAGAAGAGVATAVNKSKPKVETDASGKVIPSTASIRAKSDRVGGGNAGASTDAGLASTANMPKATPVSADPKKKLSGKERAQAMAKARIKSGKTIQQVKDENKASMIANARQRNVDFKAKRRKPPGEMKSNFAGGVSGKGKATDDFSKDPRYQSTAGTSTDIKKPVKQMGRSAAKRRQMAGEEYTPYDIVLEYLLSSKQAATIEEANYIMTEMDAKTIQSIVAE